MKRYIYRVIIFILPILGYLAIATYIDPFNYFKIETKSNIEVLKEKVAYKAHNSLYKIQKYKYNPSEVVLLGDSRTNKLKDSIFEVYSGFRTTNMSYGGGTLPEIISTFWKVNESNRLKKVYLGINFNLYNKLNSRNRVEDIDEITNSLGSYLFSSYTIKSVFSIVKSLIFNKDVSSERPNMTKDEFWGYQLNISAANFYRNYNYPDNGYKALKDISEYCGKNNIELIFFIPPTHISLQDKIKEYRLVNEEKKFKADLSSLGVVYDFDFKNTLTEKKENFLDPFHFNDSIGEIIAEELVLDKKRYSKRF